ncbi:gonad-stimulating substance-like [Acanthaster planci]|uniref:Gonad-stimulating substance-like n=1 Tax=Acanthaster planci TaxID=133434 RepID=A0A0D6A9C4_ACAPL|nr:gonad-stimulating substance-like [Acanthaster planci]BAQ59100.2 relaxin-like gonad-stimulating peptide [Acanthaster planci]BBZ90166.1 relaxin-like gonad-stimulating peptide precursor [Acanthaster planci]
MANNLRRRFQATCLVLLILQATINTGAVGEKFCDNDFHLAVYQTCSTHKRGDGEPVLSLKDVLTGSRLRGNIKRSFGSTLEDEAFFASRLVKRSEYDGIASYCCIHGCTPSELAVVC